MYHERASVHGKWRLTSASHVKAIVEPGIVWITCREFDPLTVAFCELVFKPRAHRTNVWTTPQERVGA